MVATLKTIVLCALVHYASAGLFNFVNPDKPCDEDIFERNLYGNPSSKTTWNVNGPFVEKQTFVGDKMKELRITTDTIKNLQVSVENNFEDNSINASRSVRCALLTGDKILHTFVGSEFVSNIYLQANAEIRDVQVNGTIINDLQLFTTLEYSRYQSDKDTSESNIWFNEFNGGIIENVNSVSENFAQNGFNAEYVNKLTIKSKNVSRNSIAGRSGVYSVKLNGQNVDNTIIVSKEVQDVQIESTNIEDTTIKGTLLSNVVLEGERSINRTNIHGDHLKVVLVYSGKSVENIAMKGKKLDKVAVVAQNGMSNVDISGDYIDDVMIGVHGGDIKNVRINGVAVENMEVPLQMQCSDKNAYPDDDEELGSFNKCFSKYCNIVCGATGFESGKCLGRTCCCLK